MNYGHLVFVFGPGHLGCSVTPCRPSFTKDFPFFRPFPVGALLVLVVGPEGGGRVVKYGCYFSIYGGWVSFFANYFSTMCARHFFFQYRWVRENHLVCNTQDSKMCIYIYIYFFFQWFCVCIHKLLRPQYFKYT